MKVYHNCKRAQSVWETVEANMDWFPARFVMFTVGLLDTIDDRRDTTLEQDNEDALWLSIIEETFQAGPVTRRHRAVEIQELSDMFSHAYKALHGTQTQVIDSYFRAKVWGNMAKYVQATLD